MFSDGKYMTKYQFMHDNHDTKAIAIPWVFSQNSLANKGAGNGETPW